MEESPSEAVAPPSPPTILWPQVTWILIQLGVLALAAYRVPLSARFPTPIENMAATEIVIAQTIAGAMLFPLLFRTLLSAMATLGSAVLMFHIAGFLSAEGNNAILVRTIAYVGAWLVCLAGWARVLKTQRAKLIGVATALLLSAGGALLAYLFREFGLFLLPPPEPGTPAPATFEWARFGWMGATVGAAGLLETEGSPGIAWAFMTPVVAATAIASLIGWRTGRRPPAMLITPS